VKFWTVRDALGQEIEKEEELVFEPTFTESFLYLVVPEKARRVRLTTGEDVSELEGSLLLRRAAVENTNKPVGFLDYVPTFESRDGLDLMPASYQVIVDLPARQFDELVGAARQGRMPSSISVLVVGKGVQYGWEPDGSGLDWDNKEHDHVPVGEIRFSFPLALRNEPSEYDSDHELIADVEPASRAQIERLVQGVDALRKDAKTIAGVIGFVAVLLVGRFYDLLPKTISFGDVIAVVVVLAIWALGKWYDRRTWRKFSQQFSSKARKSKPQPPRRGPPPAAPSANG
jgi:hypothetical protein